MQRSTVFRFCFYRMGHHFPIYSLITCIGFQPDFARLQTDAINKRKTNQPKHSLGREEAKTCDSQAPAEAHAVAAPVALMWAFLGPQQRNNPRTEDAGIISCNFHRC